MSADVRILLWYDYNVRKNKVSRRTGSVVLPVLSAERKCMKKTDKEVHNVCYVTGKVTTLEELSGPESVFDYFLLVETALPDGSRVHLPCGMTENILKSCGGKLCKGEWIQVLGILNGVTGEKIAGAWVDVITLKRVTKRSGRIFRNEALLTGNPIEGGCLIDRGVLMAADFVLELENLEGGTFEAVADVPQKAVQEYVDTLGCRKLNVHGALEFIPSEEDEEDAIGVTIHVDRICAAEED